MCGGWRTTTAAFRLYVPRSTQGVNRLLHTGELKSEALVGYHRLRHRQSFTREARRKTPMKGMAQ
jgi:hypothetical protein